MLADIAVSRRHFTLHAEGGRYPHARSRLGQRHARQRPAHRQRHPQRRRSDRVRQHADALRSGGRARGAAGAARHRRSPPHAAPPPLRIAPPAPPAYSAPLPPAIRGLPSPVDTPSEQRAARRCRVGGAARRDRSRCRSRWRRRCSRPRTRLIVFGAMGGLSLMSLIVIVAKTAFAKPPVVASEAEQSYRSGLKLFLAKDYEGAKINFTDALQLAPDSTDAKRYVAACDLEVHARGAMQTAERAIAEPSLRRGGQGARRRRLGVAGARRRGAAAQGAGAEGRRRGRRGGAAAAAGRSRHGARAAAAGAGARSGQPRCARAGAEAARRSAAAAGQHGGDDAAAGGGDRRRPSRWRSGRWRQAAAARRAEGAAGRWRRRSRRAEGAEEAARSRPSRTTTTSRRSRRGKDGSRGGGQGRRAVVGAGGGGLQGASDFANAERLYRMEARNQPAKQMEKTIAFANQVRDLKAVLDKAGADEGKNPPAAVKRLRRRPSPSTARIGKGQHARLLQAAHRQAADAAGAAGVLAGQVRAAYRGGAGGAERRRRRRRHVEAARGQGQGADRQGRGGAEVEPGAGQELLAPGHQDRAVELVPSYARAYQLLNAGGGGHKDEDED